MTKANEEQRERCDRNETKGELGTIDTGRGKERRNTKKIRSVAIKEEIHKLRLKNQNSMTR